MKIALSFPFLLCPAWAVSHPSYLDSMLSPRSGKLSAVWCRMVDWPAVMWEKTWVFPCSDAEGRPPSTQIPGWGVEVWPLLSHVTSPTAALPSSSSALEEGHTCKSAYSNRLIVVFPMWATYWKAVRFVFPLHSTGEIKDALSLLEPTIFGGEGLDNKQPVRPGCSQGPPGSPGPPGREVRLQFKMLYSHCFANLFTSFQVFHI